MGEQIRKDEGSYQYPTQEYDRAETREAREAMRQQRIMEYARAEAPVVADLAARGFPVEHVQDLYQLRLDYREAIPILLRWLPRVEDDEVRDTIVQALSVKWAKPIAARPLIDEFRREVSGPAAIHSKWAIGNALSVVADDSVFDDVAVLATDKRYGRARQMLAVALGNMRNPSAVDVLIELLNDDEVCGHAVMGLGKLKPKKARSHVEPFLNHERRWIRTEARHTLAKIDKAK